MATKIGNSAEVDSSQIEAKLLSQDFEEQEEGLELLHLRLKKQSGGMTHDFVLWLNNICLKLADLISSDGTKNSLRLSIVDKIFKNHADVIQDNLVNKDEFLSRISRQFNSNNPQQRISNLRLLAFCPKLLQNRLDVQH